MTLLQLKNILIQKEKLLHGSSLEKSSVNLISNSEKNESRIRMASIFYFE